MNNIFHLGRWEDNLPPRDTSLIIADPVYSDYNMINGITDIAIQRGIPLCIFMFPIDLCYISNKPNQICHWVKPISTKNTCKNYSNFVEVICFYNVKFHKTLHWSNRSGIFTDTIISNEEHPWKKPESLIEKLILNHYPNEGIIYDPCAGSRTVEVVCKRLGLPSVSVDIKDYKIGG